MKIVKFENGQYAVQDEDGGFMDLQQRGFVWSQDNKFFTDCLGTLDECQNRINEIKVAAAERNRLHYIANMKIIETIEV